MDKATRRHVHRPEGPRDARPAGGHTARIRPHELEKFVVFVQSTSVNRRLVGGTRFLYGIDDWAA